MRTETHRQTFERLKLWGGAAVLSCALLAIGPVTAQAQEKKDGGAQSGQAGKTGEKSNLNDKHVSLNVEQVSLLDAIRKLMKSVDAEFVIDSALKEATVTLHLEDVRF